MGWNGDDELVRTLKFKLHTDSEDDLDTLREQFRHCYNQYVQLTREKQTTDRRELEQHDIDTTLIQNTRQRALNKAAEAVENYFELRDVQENASYPRKKDEPMTASLNHRDGYTVEDTSTVKISTVPYNRVEATIDGREADRVYLQRVLNGQYKFGTADVLKRDGDYYIHITVRTSDVPQIDADQEHTYIGVDINESNVMLSATKPDGEVLDTLYLDYNELKDKRNELFTRMKRVKEAGKWSQLDRLSGQEENATKDFCHKLSRYAVRWINEFENPIVVLEDLNGMRDSIDYGAKMNRRLHRLPFRKLQDYIRYKAGWSSVPVMTVNAEYTSQRCPLCGYRSKQNRNKHRFNCRECGHQDHADRTATLNIAFRAATVHQTGTDVAVPSPKNFPTFRRVRLTAAGLCEQADPSPRTPIEVIMPRSAGRASL
jgi:IS605 OrfB family transposase